MKPHGNFCGEDKKQLDFSLESPASFQAHGEEIVAVDVVVVLGKIHLERILVHAAHILL